MLSMTNRLVCFSREKHCDPILKSACFLFQLVKNCRIHSEPYGYHGFDPHCRICDPALIDVFDKAAEEINNAASAATAEVTSNSVAEDEPMDIGEGLEDYEDPMDVLDLRPVDVVMADVHNEHTIVPQ